MKITALVSLAVAVLAFTEASPIDRRPRPDSNNGHSVPLTRNKNYKHNGRAQIAKLAARYPQLGLEERFSHLRNNAASSGHVPLTDVGNDLEYYGNVSVGTPAQVVKLDFDTGSSDIWFPSSACTTTACKAHTRFNSAKSSTFQNDGRRWTISYGDGSSASGTLGSDIVNVGGISVRQTIGLATKESSQFGSSPEDGLFGLGFNTIESVSGVKTFLDNAIAAGALAQPVVSAYLPSVRRNGGVGGEYLFGAIDSTKYTGSLTYVPVTQKGYWQVLIQDAAFNGQSLGQTSQGIVDTGTTLVIVGDAVAQAIHGKISGSKNDPNNGWLVPCSVKSSTANVSFKMGGVSFNVPVADLAYEDMGDGSGNCFSGIQGGQDGLWILGDVFLKNNYCVFSQTSSPSIGIAPLNY
ncbi:Type I transmembrane sorting receptor [Podila minutissima]|nr:Type I transmembrane sorting receptor [Podila minutissima]